MIIEIKIPSPGESIAEVELANWFIEDGGFVEKDQEIGEIESEKATLPLLAEDSGKIKILAQVGETLAVGAVACTIDTSAKGKTKTEKEKITKPAEEITELPAGPGQPEKLETVSESAYEKVKVSPVAKKMMEEHNLKVEDIIKGLKRITKKEVKQVTSLNNQEYSIAEENKKESTRETKKKKMSLLRKKLGERLVSVKNETAMLTTFNEADMSGVIRIRKKYQQQFTEKHGIKLGFMSFFTKAVTDALKAYPSVNSMIDGENIITFNYSDIGIAVQTDKGLMVPVLRNTESKTMAEIELIIKELADKARRNRISMDEMSGGTFTITNGGLFGSMLSTPILNPPQAGIFGMHNIVERPVAIDGKVEIRPIMYLALSYDHRLVDGRDSVGFLVKVKEFIETPIQLLFEGMDPERILLGL